MSQQVSRADQIKPALVSINKQVQSLYNGDKERANKMIAAALVIGCDPALRNCSPESIGQAVIGVAMMDLSIDKTMGHCYLVPYGNGVQLQVGYKGMIQLLFRAGWAIKSFPVYECDEFDIGEIDYLGNTTSFKFKQNIDDRNEGDKDWVYQNLRGVYVVAQHADTKDVYSTFVAKQSIEKLRKVSPNQKNSQFPTGIWKDWYESMAIAKAVKVLAKRLPIGDSRAAIALAIDDKTDIGTAVNYEKTANTGMVIDMESTPEPKQKSRSVDSLVGGQAETIIETETVASTPVQQPVEPPIDEADYNEMPMDLQPESTGTMSIPELAPEPVKSGLVVPPQPYISLHDQWRAKIDGWQTKLDVTQGLAEMPPQIKADLKPYYTSRNDVIKGLEVDFGAWKDRITKCNSREEFASVEKEMPPVVKDNDDIKKFMQTREAFCMQNFPDLW
jgi:recombination protein RecT